MRTRGITSGGLSRLAGLSRDKAEILSLPVDARDVLVTNPDIADVIMKTPKMAYILGQAIGETNVFFFDESGRQITRIEVSVERDIFNQGGGGQAHKEGGPWAGTGQNTS